MCASTIADLVNPNINQKPTLNIYANSINSNSVVSITNQSTFQEVHQKGIKNTNGQVTVNLLPVDIFSTEIFSPAASGTTTMNLPSVASLKTYLQSLNLSLAFNLSFDFTIVNQTAGVIALQNGGDTNWSFATAQAGAPPFNIAANSSIIFGVVIGAGAQAFILG